MKSLLVNVTELNCYISSRLIPHLGPSAVSNNYSEIIRLMIESVLYPYTDFPYDNIHREFSLYGIDRNVSEGVIGDLSVMAYRLVGWYKRQFTSYDEHVFDVIVKDANCVQIAYLGIARVQSQQSLEEQLKQQIMSDMDNGHFIPEKTRHLAGVY